MAEADVRQQAAAQTDTVTAPTVIVDDVHVTYRVYQDRHPGLREIVSRGLRQRPSTKIHAVRGVSLTALRGEAIAVIGRNGSGKSTLMRAIAGSLPVTQGQIYASSQPMLLGVGAALKPDLSGRRNVVIGLLALGLSRGVINEMYDEIVEFSGLAEAIGRPMRTYSSGMRARLQFAISTAVAPEILLLDEALAVGDEEFKDRSKARIRELRDKAGTVFVVSHSLSEIRATCTRAVWLNEGKIAEEGDSQDVVAAYKRFHRGLPAPGDVHS